MIIVLLQYLLTCINDVSLGIAFYYSWWLYHESVKPPAMPAEHTVH